MAKLAPFGSVYRVTCLVSGKAYIGLTRGYVSNRWHQHRAEAAKGASSALYAAMRKYGDQAFVVEQVACAVDAAALGDLERLLIAQHATLAPGGYNLSMGGESHLARRLSAEGRDRLTASRADPAWRAKNAERGAARAATPEGRAHQALMVEAARQAGAALSASRKRYAATEGGLSQICAAAKMGAARKAELSSKAVAADGVVHESVSAAAEAHGIERNAVRYRIKSANFTGWGWAHAAQ